MITISTVIAFYLLYGLAMATIGIEDEARLAGGPAEGA